MILATQTILSVDQFMAMPEASDGTQYELSGGELLTFPPAGARHGFIQGDVFRVLDAVLDRKR